MSRSFLLLVSILFLAGCAGMDGIAPSQLSRPEQAASFALAKDVIGEMTSTNGFGAKSKYAVGLVSGTYHAVAADEHGTYFAGPKGCVANSASSFKRLDGGIWLPKAKSSAEPRFWYYLRKVEFPDHVSPGFMALLFNEISIGNLKIDQSTRVESFLLDQIKIQAQ